MPKFSGCLMAALLASALMVPTNAGAEPPKKGAVAAPARAAPAVHAAPHVAAPHFAPHAGGGAPHFTGHRIAFGAPRISPRAAAAPRTSRATSERRT